MKNTSLLKQLNKLEDKWYYDFKGSIFEDTDVFIYNEEDDIFDDVDVSELKKELNVLINECIPTWIDEAIDEERKQLHESWKAKFENLLSSL